MAESVKVVVRCRPLSEKEKENKCARVVNMNTNNGLVEVVKPDAGKEAPKQFTFDTVYDWNSTQRAVYDGTAFPIVESVLGGYNGTIFAYGQTGTGKTHTMTGVPDIPDLRGITPNAFAHIFSAISSASGEEYLVRASYLEIYNEEIRDLLGDPKSKLQLKESPDSGVFVKDLSVFVVKGTQEIDALMSRGAKNRVVGATHMNAQSSRSHSIFTITIESSTPGPDGKPKIKAGKLHLVDLAGSERQSKTGATGARLAEGAAINLSLSALGNVISALVDGKAQHIPYRDSKLTRLLQDSLGGNSKTVMVANLGPADYNYEETVSTLRYANRAKNIKNKPKINEDPKDAMLREFQEEIARLKAQLESAGPGATPRGDKPGIVEQSGYAADPGTVIELVVDPEILAQVEKETADKLQQLEHETGMAESEKAKIMEQLKATDTKAEAMRRAKEEATNRLNMMQQQLLVGGVNILDVHAKQEEQLRAARSELEKQAREEQRLREMLAQQEEENLLKEEKYTSVQQEIEGKTKKLKKVWTRIQSSKQEIEDLQAEFQRDREDITDTIRDLTRQLKLKMLVISRFVPPEDLADIERCAEWDDESNDWAIAHWNLAGNNVRPHDDGDDISRDASYVNVAAASVQAGHGQGHGQWDHMFFNYSGGGGANSPNGARARDRDRDPYSSPAREREDAQRQKRPQSSRGRPGSSAGRAKGSTSSPSGSPSMGRTHSKAKQVGV